MQCKEANTPSGESQTAKGVLTFPEEVRDLLVSLEFLGQTKNGNKINTKNMSFVAQDSWSGSLFRTFSGEDRRHTVRFILQLIDHAVEVLAKLSKSPNKQQATDIYCKRILDKLEKAKEGIKNIRETYADDPHIVSQLNVCLDTIDLQFGS